MSNGIKARENENHSIEMLGAQRELYNEAKWADKIRFFISVILPFSLSVIAVFAAEDSLVRGLTYSVSILGGMASLLINRHIKSMKVLAATIQQQFDVYVYNMQWNNKMFGKKTNMDSEIAEYSKKLFDKCGEREKLFDWYPPSVDSKSIEEGIMICQRENCWWDVGLRKRYKYSSVALIIILSVIVLAIGIAKNESIVKVLWWVAFIAPMYQWLIGTIDSLNEDIERLQELSDAVNGCDTYSMEDFQEIQKMIFEHRKNCLAIPNMVYEIFKDNYEDKAYRIVNK